LKKRKGADETPNNNSSRTNIKNLSNVKDKERVSHETPSQNTIKDDNTTRVYPSRKHGIGLWGNPRVPMTVRVDKGIKKQFLLFSKRVFGSSCLPLESLMAGIINTVVEAEKTGVYPSSTIPLKLDIEKIVIERNLRPRRRLELSDDPDDLACHYCGSSAVGNFRYLKTGQVYPLCGFHAKVNLDSKAWEVVNDE